MTPELAEAIREMKESLEAWREVAELLDTPGDLPFNNP